MSLVKVNKSPLDVMERTFENWVENFDRGLMWPRVMRPDLYVPNLDLSEDADNYYVSAELPGLDIKDVKLTFEDGNLTIRGKKERIEEKKERSYHHIERSFGEFARTWALPVNIKGDKIAAEFENGLLEIVIPKEETMKVTAREIPLKAQIKTIHNGKS